MDELLVELFGSAAYDGVGELPHPLSILEGGHFDDLSDACLLLDQVDGLNIAAYEFVLNFAFRCSRKSILKLFSHPGSGPPNVVHSFEGMHAETHFNFYCFANVAIFKYNHLNKDTKLRLVNLIKVNTTWCLVEYLYMTFSAINDRTGKLGVYQAALICDRHGAGLVLGLFRDYFADKTLAIISIPGAEDYLSAQKKLVEDGNASVRQIISRYEMPNGKLPEYQGDGEFTTRAYDDLIKACTQKLGQQSTKDHLKNYLRTWDAYYLEVLIPFSTISTDWVKEALKFEDDDEVWKSFIEGEAERWKTTSIHHFDSLTLKDRATGEVSISAKEKYLEICGVESSATREERTNEARSDSIEASDNVVPSSQEGNGIVREVRPPVYPPFKRIKFVRA